MTSFSFSGFLNIIIFKSFKSTWQVNDNFAKWQSKWNALFIANIYLKFKITMQDLNTKKVSIKYQADPDTKTSKEWLLIQFLAVTSCREYEAEELKVRGATLFKTCFIVFAVCQVYSASDMDLMLSDALQCKTAWTLGSSKVIKPLHGAPKVYVRGLQLGDLIINLADEFF